MDRFLAQLSVLPPESTQQAVGYPSVFLLVALGALVPVVPTGAVVSTAAVVAFHQSSPVPALSMVLLFLVASGAAFLGDVALYWLGRRGVGSKNGSRWLTTLRRNAPPDRLEQAQRKLRERGVTVLVLSRLVPAGRIPVMLACLVGEWPLRRFARGDVPACLAWAATYQLIGVAGGSLFAEPWEGVLAAVVLTVLVSGGPALWRRVRRRTRSTEDSDGSDGTHRTGRTEPDRLTGAEVLPGAEPHPGPEGGRP
ncbi:DedA family protein [Streptomyces sp. NPDC059142]|uniref:DedA family protein n=1 Tax=Streptomyces sp. NPDC059142 TaxID=3346739 RepID=UPI00368F4553